MLSARASRAVVGASAWTVARLVALRRRTGAYDLSDAFGGLALLEGVAVGVAFALARYSPGPDGKPPEDHDRPA